MQFLKRLFGKATPGPSAPVLPEPGNMSRTIRYDAGLVDSLKNDHQDLVAMYTQLAEDATAGRFDRIDAGLQAFKIRLEAHLLTENVRFYVYLEQMLGEDPENTELIRGFRREMNSIARGVVEFVRRFRNEPVGPSNQADFLREHGNVGQLLTQRIAREESELYVLYHL